MNSCSSGRMPEGYACSEVSVSAECTDIKDAARTRVNPAQGCASGLGPAAQLVERRRVGAGALADGRRRADGEPDGTHDRRLVRHGRPRDAIVDEAALLR